MDWQNALFAKSDGSIFATSSPGLMEKNASHMQKEAENVSDETCQDHFQPMKNCPGH
jgi:hypothetical protein